MNSGRILWLKPNIFRLAGDCVTLLLHQVWSSTVVVVSQIKTSAFLIRSWRRAISYTFLPFTPSSLSGKSKVSFNQVWAWTDVMFTDWDSGFQTMSGTSGLVAWQRAQQIANPKAQVHKQLWGFHPVTRKPWGQRRWYCSSLLNHAALLPMCSTADLCLLSESSDQSPAHVHAGYAMLAWSLSTFSLYPTTFTSCHSHGWQKPWGKWDEVKLCSLQAGTMLSTSLCIPQQDSPYLPAHLCVSICHSSLYRLLFPEAPEKSVPCEGLNSGLQPAGGAAWAEDCLESPAAADVLQKGSICI